MFFRDTLLLSWQGQTLSSFQRQHFCMQVIQCKFQGVPLNQLIVKRERIKIFKPVMILVLLEMIVSLTILQTKEGLY